MSESRTREVDPRLLLEAARVFNAAGPDYKNIAEVVAESALQAKDKAEVSVRDAIIGDAVALRLSGRVPGGYRAALQLLTTIENDSDGRLHLLRALANGQRYRAMLLAGRQKEEKELDDLRRQIREDLAFAFRQNELLKTANQHFWHPDPAVLAAGAGREDDLWAVYEDDPEFRKLVEPNDLNPAPAEADNGARLRETPISGDADAKEATRSENAEPAPPQQPGPTLELDEEP
jgi:hypothetical protein